MRATRKLFRSFEANKEFARKKKPWDLHKNIFKVKKTTYTQECEQFFRPPNSTTPEKVVASRSDCEHEDRELIVDSGASLHMMSKNEPNSGEKRYHEKIEPTVITTDSGKAESTEEATVCVNVLDVFVTMMLLEDSQQCYLCVYYAKK